MSPMREHQGMTLLDSIDFDDRWTLLNFPVFLRQRTDVYVCTNLHTDNIGTWVDTPKDILRATPFIVPQRCTLAGIGIRVMAAGAGGAVCRLGIYDDDGNLYPNDLVIDAGTVDCTGTGFLHLATTPTINSGLYWLASLTNDATIDFYQIRCLPLITEDVTYSGWQVAQAYGALPDPFTAGGTANYALYISYQINTWL